MATFLAACFFIFFLAGVVAGAAPPALAAVAAGAAGAAAAAGVAANDRLDPKRPAAMQRAVMLDFMMNPFEDWLMSVTVVLASNQLNATVRTHA